jgi:putative restriction endonuclease
MERQCPLIWFWGIASDIYLPIYPIYLIEEEPHLRQFVVGIDQQSSKFRALLLTQDPILLREYAAQVTKERFHDPIFREKVLFAYSFICAVCDAQSAYPLEVAQIVPNSEEGQMDITNSIAMCKVHHAAYDMDILGIDTENRIAYRNDVRSETWDSLLKRSLGFSEGRQIKLPTSRSARPSPEFLELRWGKFVGVS